MLAQAAQTWNVGIPWDQGVSLRLPRLDRAPVELMEAAMKKYPKLIFADTGLGVNVINFGELFPPELVLDLQRTFRSGLPIPTHNVSAYIDFADAWSQKPGSGSVTRQMFSEIEQMTPQDQRALDRAVREPAGKMEQFYMQQQGTRKEPVREDLMNLLRIMRDQGLVGAKQALQSGAFLPGLVGALVLPAILDMSRQEQEPVSWLPQ
jgi:hypothetical protein